MAAILVPLEERAEKPKPATTMAAANATSSSSKRRT
jgi:hypothetical protein